MRNAAPVGSGLLFDVRVRPYIMLPQSSGYITLDDQNEIHADMERWINRRGQVERRVNTRNPNSLRRAVAESVRRGDANPRVMYGFINLSALDVDVFEYLMSLAGNSDFAVDPYEIHYGVQFPEFVNGHGDDDEDENVVAGNAVQKKRKLRGLFTVTEHLTEHCLPTSLFVATIPAVRERALTEIEDWVFMICNVPDSQYDFFDNEESDGDLMNIQQFIEIHPENRIIVLITTPEGDKIEILAIFESENWRPEWCGPEGYFNSRITNQRYLYYRHTKRRGHYSWIENIEKFVRSVYQESRAKICDQCFKRRKQPRVAVCDHKVSTKSLHRKVNVAESRRDKRKNRSYCYTCQCPFPPFGYKHTHNMIFCTVCKIEMRKEEYYSHRHYVNPQEDVDTTLPTVFAWDCESMFKKVRIQSSIGSRPYAVCEFDEHHVNLVVIRNIRNTDSEDFSVFTSMTEMVAALCEYSEQREGEHVWCYAHNSSGYDTRLLFNEVRAAGYAINKHQFLARGTKILHLHLFKAKEYSIHFLDSLLHIQGSLRKCGKDFGCEEVKGYFPYLFNLPENQNYAGPIPHEDYFDPQHMKNTEEYNLFREWYEEEVSRRHVQNDIWVFQDEIRKYCIQDVRVLCEILLKYEAAHRFATQLPGQEDPDFSTGISPLRCITAASVAQHMFINRFMKPNTIACLEYAEHDFARRALRGGRTDVKANHYNGKFFILFFRKILIILLNLFFS
jgi:hypothetical protein